MTQIVQIIIKGFRFPIEQTHLSDSTPTRRTKKIVTKLEAENTVDPTSAGMPNISIDGIA